MISRISSVGRSNRRNGTIYQHVSIEYSATCLRSKTYLANRAYFRRFLCSEGFGDLDPWCFFCRDWGWVYFARLRVATQKQRDDTDEYQCQKES